MIDLYTVTNNVFAPCVFNLIESYKLNSCNQKIYVIYFDLDEKYINLFKSKYDRQIELVKVEEECDHAYNPRFYFPKAYALKVAFHNKKTFMLCDASNAFVSKTYELEYLLEKNTRFFVEYPEEIFKNKYWATEKSLKLMNCNKNSFKEAQSYWSGFHAYIPTEENLEMIHEQYVHMLNAEIAGPSNLLKHPEGLNSNCIAHRNDQTVLSIMIEKYNFNQKFDINKYSRYGDLQTAQVMLPDLYSQINKNLICLYSRHSKFNDFSFISKNLLNEINSIKNIYNIDRNTGKII